MRTASTALSLPWPGAHQCRVTGSRSSCRRFGSAEEGDGGSGGGTDDSVDAGKIAVGAGGLGEHCDGDCSFVLVVHDADFVTQGTEGARLPGDSHPGVGES